MLDEMKNSYGYVNDVTILTASLTLEKNTRKKIAKAINLALSWGGMEGLTVDPGKSELLHFSRKNRDKNNNSTIITNKFLFKVDQKKLFLKWLGILFNGKLNFKLHVMTQIVLHS